VALRRRPHCGRGVGNRQIAGIVDASRLVQFGAARKLPADGTAPPFTGRVLILKTPEMSGNDVLTCQQPMLQARVASLPRDRHVRPPDP
jgi:hypothetical protein